jgi:hypothetical protein
VDLLEQIAVSVEKGAVHGRGARDAGHADLRSVRDRFVEAAITRWRRLAESACRPFIIASVLEPVAVGWVDLEMVI